MIRSFLTEQWRKLLIPIAAIAVLSSVLFFPREQADITSEERGLTLFETIEEPAEEMEPPAEILAEVAVLPILVDVKGAVKHPGLYSLTEGDRLHDAVEKAGGYRDDADTRLLNHAQKLLDESVVYVPVAGEEPPVFEQPSTTAAGGGDSDSALININTANETEFQQLPGIGPSKATAIVKYREANGAFSQLDGLKEVSGIGDKTFEKLEALITL
ncbi:helix-hairpin-helix domain-containing protein [Sporosarcina cascadiensis]|uniref:helix-hairpin-helix domain-containing protein n=1 Tax=Sporosarcina cascadiensis TaxID=2660747 RepID=UPI00129A5C4C|nr:helix-hairpin-helix domain-containing protein [Sporosarcina cascadiensis]